MRTPTKATIVIEIEVPVSGNWCPAEPDVGINQGWFEDYQIDWKSPTMSELNKLDDAYSEQIQEALAEARADDNARADDRRDEAADAKAHHDRENRR